MICYDLLSSWINMYSSQFSRLSDYYINTKSEIGNVLMKMIIRQMVVLFANHTMAEADVLHESE